jgi:signal peptidase I
VRKRRTRLVTGALVLLLAAAWLFAGPAQLGGRTTYVATHGISMEPRFHTGDLALVRPAADYRVGDVVAYRSAVLRRVVLHRIIGRDGDRYVFQGDNNDFVDPVHPERYELIGRLWLRVPRGGAVLALLHSPPVAALLCGAVALLVVWPARRRRRRGRRGRPGGGPAVSRPPRRMSPDAQLLLSGCAALAAACLVLGVVAWLASASHPVATKVAYTQKVRFSYRAEAPAGAVYPRGTVRTGDPIFVRLVRRVRVKVAYRLASAAPATLAGTQEVALRLSSPSGWSRTLPLQAATPFRGAATSAWVDLDLDRLQALIHRVEAQTGAAAGGAFTVDVLARVRVKGTLAGQDLDDHYEPALTFQLDPLQLRTGVGNAGGAPGAATAPGALPAAFTPSRGGSVAALAREPGHLSAGRFSVRVSTARWIALLGLLIAGAAAVLATVRERRRPTDPSMQIHARYKHLIVPVSSIVLAHDQPIVDVMSIEALAQVAERCERVILHHHRIGAETYLVDDEGTLYRYQPRPYAGPQAVPAPLADVG